MPVHDWGKVPDGVFHDFHHEWISTVKQVLNDGLLPPDYYAMADQITGAGNPDVLGLQRVRPAAATPPRAGGGVLLATAAPRVTYHDQQPARRQPARRTKRVAVRHVSGNRVALVEIVSPGNKSGPGKLRPFVRKLKGFVEDGIHLLVLDVHPPGRRDPQGLHPLVWSAFHRTPFALPPDRPLTLAAYNAGPPAQAFVTPVGVGALLPEMPLFLTPDVYVNVPLERSYQMAWARFPGPEREMLEPLG